MSDVINYLIANADALQQKTMEHIFLSIVAILLASIIAIPLGIIITRANFLRHIILKIGSVSQTIPSLAMLAFLVPFLGLGIVPTMIVLSFYATYPILRSTYTGLINVPSEYKEAADGLGFSPFNKLWYVELPLAFPVIISGLRVATAMTIGIATIAAFIGAGGLGDFIVQGLSLNDSYLILLGAIPTALLALFFDYGISQIENGRRSRLAIIIISTLVLFFLGNTILKNYLQTNKNTIVIASKNFPEQNLLAEMMSQLIEAKTNLKVIRKFNLGTTSIVHQALLRGEIDLYPEYTGVAYRVILKKPMTNQTNDIFSQVQKDYHQKFNLIWLEPFGFLNSQSLAVKKDFAKRNHLTTMSDLALISANLKIAAPPDFLKRPDALPGLIQTYGLKFNKIIQIDPTLTYLAIENHSADVIAASTTDGKLLQYDLVTLRDDKGMYPPYAAAAVVRNNTLTAHPEIHEALQPIIGTINNETMQSLNYQVEVKKLPVAKVAQQFLSSTRIQPHAQLSKTQQ